MNKTTSDLKVPALVPKREFGSSTLTHLKIDLKLPVLSVNLLNFDEQIKIVWIDENSIVKTATTYLVSWIDVLLWKKALLLSKPTISRLNIYSIDIFALYFIYWPKRNWLNSNVNISCWIVCNFGLRIRVPKRSQKLTEYWFWIRAVLIRFLSIFWIKFFKILRETKNELHQPFWSPSWKICKTCKVCEEKTEILFMLQPTYWFILNIGIQVRVTWGENIWDDWAKYLFTK